MFWVAGVQIDPGDNNLNAVTTPWVIDNEIRSYQSWAEANAHAAGTTDHLGVLRAPPLWQDTWLRFHPAELNILGETHDLIDLEQVRGDVVGANAANLAFTYERFATDAFTPGSHLETAYDAETLADHQAFGIQAVVNKRPYGGESLYPKMGFVMVMAAQVLNGLQLIPRLRQAAGYLGQPVQRYMKLVWAHAKDVAAEVGVLNNAGQAVPPAKAALAAAVANHTGTLDGWLDLLPVDGWLGDALTPLPNAQVVPAMRNVALGAIPELLARVATDGVLTLTERNTVAGMRQGNPDELQDLFLEWRDLHFMHVVHDAAVNNVRYSGMGSKHLDYLHAAPGRFPPNTQSFYMDGDDLYDFATETVRLSITAH